MRFFFKNFCSLSWGSWRVRQKVECFWRAEAISYPKTLDFPSNSSGPPRYRTKVPTTPDKSNSGTSATGPKWFWDQWRPIANLTWKSEVSRLPRWVSTDASKHYLNVIDCICCAFWCTLSHIICKNKIALRFLWKKLAKISDLENLVDFMSILAQKRVPIANLGWKSEVSIRSQNFIRVW